jgi:eukaryotic-like serine/threonine-protein kinase
MAKIPPTELLEERVGHVVKNRYELLALLGVGGQGAVYRALDRRDGDQVAVKVLHEEIDRDPTARERLLREAQALVALRGTAALQVLDQGFSPDGRLCLVVELLEGEDLEEALLSREARGVAFAPGELAFVFEPLVTTLERAHEVHIIHRDLKPANVFIDRRGGGTPRVRLMDFGFAKLLRLSKLTMDGFVAGSPSYIAPESWLERPSAASVDVYALGAMMFRAFAGRPPFAAENLVEVFRGVTTGPRPSLHALRPDLPPSVDGWVEQALAISPEQRFRTPRAVYHALASVLGVAPR